MNEDKYKPVFQDAQLADRLRQVAQGWIGTRYAHMGTSKAEKPGAGGVDCTKLMALVLVELGLMSGIEPEIYYSRDWMVYSDREVMLEAFSWNLARYLAQGHRYELLKWRPHIPLELGDILAFCVRPKTVKRPHAKGLCNHTAMYMGDWKMLHAIEGRGVDITDYTEDWRGKSRFIFRITRRA